MFRTLISTICISFMVATAALPAASFAGADTKSSQLLALSTILAELDTHYGMLDFKEQKLGITLESLRKKYTKLIQSATTLEENAGLVEKTTPRKQLSNDEFQQLMIGMIAEWQDGHINLTRQSQEYYSVGMYTAGIDGRLFFTGFNKDLLVPGRAARDPQIGDEIISVDGESVQDIAKRLRLYAQSGSFESRNNFALGSILARSRAFFPALKEGSTVNVKFRRGDEEFDGQYTWMETRGYRNDRAMSPETYNTELLKAMDEKVPAPFGIPNTVQSYFRTGLDNLQLAPGLEYDMGALLNGEIIAAAERGEESAILPVKRLTATVIRYAGRNVGVLRIPSYSPASPQIAVNELRWTAEILRRMQNAADVLIVDQVSNGGGYVFYVGAMASLLSGGQPLNSITVNMRLNETLLNRYSDPSVGADSMTGARPNWAQNRLGEMHYENLRNKYKSGEKWSGPMAMFDPNTSESDYQFAKIMPAQDVKFTLPLLVLNDSRSGSGGDMLPGLLAANKRAVVMGEASSGLGGPVYRNVDSMTSAEFGFRCTMGYCQRPDGLPIEDLGVVPGLVRPVRGLDLRDGFRVFANGAMSAAVALSLGVPVDQIQEGLKQIVDVPESMSTHGDPEVAALKKKFEKFRKSELFKTADADFRAAMDKGLVDAYGELFEALRAVESKGVPAAAFYGLVLPVPKSLLVQDTFLTALYRRQEFAERLTELMNLKKWKKDEAALQLFAVLRDGLANTTVDIWTAHPCELLLDH